MDLTTQGDPLAMPFCAMFTFLIISILGAKFDSVKQVRLADDALAEFHKLLVPKLAEKNQTKSS